ncbi:putative plastid-lipid-associated protein 13, chloroplastic isoform X2 [Tasmannia lanceolata]|uniref:putative plastid-lipid-associated protein 13, chloroplastic isoform X2 n=1 Tax=Tasmannia lanceolata TaxID=3420 RepID=UPI00406398D1
MAAVLDLIPTFAGFRTILPSSCHCSSSSFSSIRCPESGRNLGFRRRNPTGVFRAMVQQQVVQGASATYAKEMERLSAKESLLLAFKDSGGFEALVSGKTTDMQRIDVNERITGLERLNPTLRPTTSPFLEGRWSFQWFGAGSPGLFAARILFVRFPASLVNLLALDVLIKDGYAKAAANLKFLNSIQSKFILTAKLSVEGPIRMKEEYIEGVFETPAVSEEAVPEQLKSAFGQAVDRLQQFPAPIKDVMANGLTIPLSGTYQRMFMISYLDEEILIKPSAKMIIRDTSGLPDVLTRLEGPSAPMAVEDIAEYES